MASFIPVLVAALCALGVAATGWTQTSFFGTPLEDTFHGFFLSRYPLFLFAVAYGVARIVVAAASEPGGAPGLRAFTAPLSVALFLLASLYPTFGGLVLRLGYMTGGMVFVGGQSALAAVLVGAGAAALVYATALGPGVMLARFRIGFHWGAVGAAALRVLALWAGAVILLGPALAGVDLTGGWPARPLSAPAALAIAALVLTALLPHALVAAWAARRPGPDGRSARTPSAGPPLPSGKDGQTIGSQRV